MYHRYVVNLKKAKDKDKEAVEALKNLENQVPATREKNVAKQASDNINDILKHLRGSIKRDKSMLKEEKEEILHFWETRMKMFSEDTLGTGRMSELRSRSYIKAACEMRDLAKKSGGNLLEYGIPSTAELPPIDKVLVNYQCYLNLLMAGSQTKGSLPKIYQCHMQINNWDDDLGDRSDFLEANSFKSKISGATLALELGGFVSPLQHSENREKLRMCSTSNKKAYLNKVGFVKSTMKQPMTGNCVGLMAEMLEDLHFNEIQALIFATIASERGLRPGAILGSIDRLPSCWDEVILKQLPSTEDDLLRFELSLGLFGDKMTPNASGIVNRYECFSHPFKDHFGTTRRGWTATGGMVMYGLMCGAFDVNNIHWNGSDKVVSIPIKESARTMAIFSTATLGERKNSGNTSDMYKCIKQLCDRAGIPQHAISAKSLRCGLAQAVLEEKALSCQRMGSLMDVIDMANALTSTGIWKSREGSRYLNTFYRTLYGKTAGDCPSRLNPSTWLKASKRVQVGQILCNSDYSCELKQVDIDEIIDPVTVNKFENARETILYHRWESSELLSEDYIKPQAIGMDWEEVRRIGENLTYFPQFLGQDKFENGMPVQCPAEIGQVRCKFATTDLCKSINHVHTEEKVVLKCPNCYYKAKVPSSLCKHAIVHKKEGLGVVVTSLPLLYKAGYDANKMEIYSYDDYVRDYNSDKNNADCQIKRNVMGKYRNRKEYRRENDYPRNRKRCKTNKNAGRRDKRKKATVADGSDSDWAV